MNLDCFVAPSGLLAMTLPILSERNMHQHYFGRFTHAAVACRSRFGSADIAEGLIA